MDASTLTRAIALLAAVSTIPSSMAQKLTKPIINPQFPSLNQGLWDNLKPTMNSQVTNWGWGCKASTSLTYTDLPATVE